MLLPYERIEQAVRNLFAKKPNLIEPNVEIMKRGYEIGREAREKAAQEG
jgi:Pyruvate/2-oxoacid:ferredoxin oxidoreductase gamma subunit